MAQPSPLLANVHQTDLGTFTSVSARKQRTSRCLGLACDKQVKIGNCRLGAHRGSHFPLSISPALPVRHPICNISRGANKPMRSGSASIGVPAGFEPLAGSPMRIVE